MKNTKKTTLKQLLFIACCVIVTGIGSSCQRKHEGSGGSVVGNGFIRFHSDSFDFGFSYPRDLILTTISEREIMLDNEHIASKLGLKSSEIKFAISTSKDLESINLEEMARSLASGISWKAIETSGVKGLYYRQQTKNSLDTRYLFKLDERTALDVNASATSAANGIALITAVIESITFDTQSPVIHEVRFEPAVVQAGQTAKLKIRATDNMTAILGKSPRGNVAVGLDENCRELVTEDWKSVESCGEFRSIGQDWYEYDIQTSPKMKPGKYVLRPISIWDSAGNPTELVADHQRGVYLTGNILDQARLPIVYLQVENSSPDMSPPTLQNVRFEPSIILPGDSGKLIFESNDNDPDYFPASFCEKALHKDWFRFTRTDIPTSADVDPTEYKVLTCSRPTKRSDGLWEVPFKSERGLPAGDYVIDFRVRDLANNNSESNTATLLIQGNEAIDLRGPEVLELKSSQKTIKRGEKGLILIRATDDVSGVAEQLKRTTTLLCNTGLVPASVSSLDTNDKHRIPLCDGAFKHVDQDWYSIEFTLGEKIPVGTYALPNFTIEDRVGNKTFITSSKSREGDVLYANKFSGESLGIPVLTIEVVE